MARRFKEPQGQTYLKIASFNSKTIIGEIDLSEYHFCEGLDDNCHEDGIFMFTSVEHSHYIAIQAHVGAHSQMISIFQINENSIRKVFEETAKYALTTKHENGTLIITKDDGKTTKWPTK